MINPISVVRDWFRPNNSDNTLTGTSIQEILDLLNKGHISSSGVPVSVDAAQGLAAYSISVRVLSDAIAHLPLVTYRKSDGARTKATDLRIYSLLHDQPNEWHTSYQWRKLGLRDLLYRGAWYNLKVPGFGGTQEILRIHPDAVTPRKDLVAQRLLFDVQTPSGIRTFDQDEIFYVWFDSDDGINGLNPIKVHRNSIGDGISIREHGSQFFRNAARLSGLIKQDPGIKMAPEDLKVFLKDFNSQYSGQEQGHKTGAMPPGFSFEPVSVSMDDAQWIEARKTTAREIYGILGVPPHKGGDLADATFSNVEQENLSFVIDSLTPRIVALEQSIKSQLLQDADVFTKFNVAALLRGSFKARQEGLNIQRRAGIINANEWRVLEDMNPRTDEGGDEYIIEINMKKQDGKDDEGQE